MSQTQADKKSGQLIVERINKTRQQVRMVELVTMLVTLAACLLIFLLASVLVDHWVFKNGTPRVLRYVGLLSIVAVGVAYFVLRLIPLIRFSVNPAYAAEVLEKWHPDMKNRLVNWVFLRREKRGKSSDAQTQRLVIESIGRETAANLKAIPDQFVVDRTAMIRWGIVLVCVLAMFCVYIVFSPKNTLQSVGRVATPYMNIEAPQSIVIKAVEPGDATVYQGETLQIKARLDRSTKKPVYVVYSTDDGRLMDQRMPMQASDDSMRFECRFPPGKRGFEESLHYHIEVGNARSKNYAITVSPSIAIDVKSVEYHYPAYTKLPVRTVENSGDLRAVEGTQVVINAGSNIAMSQATLMPNGDVARAIKLVIAQSKTEARGTLTLGFEPNQPDKPICTTYTLRCWDNNQRTNVLPSVYRVEVVRDEAPTVKWVDDIDEREPMQVPLNQPFDVAVSAKDPDFGLQKVRLRGTITRVVAGAAVRQGNVLPETSDLPFETIELLQKPPRTGTVAIKKTMVPSKLGLQVGDRVTYFAEAVDTKQPVANTAATSPRVFVVTDIDPDQPQDPQVNDEPQEQSSEQQSEDSDQSSEEDGKQSDDQDTNDGTDQQQSQTGDGDQDQGAGKESSQESGQSEGQPNQQQNNGGGSDSQMTTGDPEQSEGGSEQKNQGDGTQSSESSTDDPNAGSSNGANQQNSDGDQQQGNNQPGNQQGNDKQPNQQGNDNQQNQPGQQNQERQPGQQTDQQPDNQQDQQKGQGQRQRQGQPGQPQPGTQNGTRPQAEKRNKPIDGESNPGDVLNEVVDHMRETGNLDDEANRNANESNEDASGNENRQQTQNGDREQGGNAPDQTPEHDDTRTGDQTDAYRTQSGNDPNAEQLDPDSDKPIYGTSDDDRANATEANTPGHSMTDDQSRGNSPERENTRSDEDEKTDMPETTGDQNGNRPSPQDSEKTPTGEQTSGNENPSRDGTGDMAGNGGGGIPQNQRQGTSADDKSPEPKADAANLEYTRQVTDLAVRYLEDELGKERPDPHLLERLGGWNENDLRRFVDRWKEMQHQAGTAPGTREGRQLDETLRSIGNLAPKATVSQQRSNALQTRTATTEAQRYAPPPGKYNDRMKAYTEGINR